MTMPTHINVTKAITYDVATCIEQLKEDGIENPTYEEVLEHIEGLCEDDFSCGWGHTADLKELIFTDENGDII